MDGEDRFNDLAESVWFGIEEHLGLSKDEALLNTQAENLEDLDSKLNSNGVIVKADFSAADTLDPEGITKLSTGYIYKTNGIVYDVQLESIDTDTQYLKFNVEV